MKLAYNSNIFHKRLVQARQLVSELKKKTGAIQLRDKNNILEV